MPRSRPQSKHKQKQQKQKQQQQQQQQSGADRNTFYAASRGMSRDEPEQKEGIQIKGGSQTQANSRDGGDGGDRDCGRESDRRSKSPKQSDSRSPDRRRDYSRDTRKPSCPFTSRITHDDLIRQEQARGSQTPTPPALAPVKRKRMPDNDDQPQSGKKTRTQGEMHPTTLERMPEAAVDAAAAKKGEAAKKEAKDLTVVKQMTEEEKAFYRANRFGAVSEAPVESPIAPKDTSKNSKQRGFKDTKVGREVTSISQAETLVTDATTAHKDSASDKKDETVISAKRDGSHPKVAATMTRQKPTTKPTTAANAPNQSSDNTASSILKGQGHESATPSTPNNPSSSKSGTPANRKRPNPGETTHTSSKKPRLGPSDAVASPNQTAGSELQSEKDKKQLKEQRLAQQKKNNSLLKAMNDLPEYEDKNIEKELKFVDYGVFSIPLLCSTSIEHQHLYEPVYKLSAGLKMEMSESAAAVFEFTMIELRQKALYISRQKYLSSKDLGRNKVRKSKPTRIIDDCDLYLYEGKIHVATESGLMSAADYLQLIGVPDEQPVRFEGHEPAWMAPVKAKREHRRVLAGYKATSAEEKKYGNIDIVCGSTVVVYESGVELVDGEENVMAYGARVGDGVTGWFPYAYTRRMDWADDTPFVPDPNIVDWTMFNYEALVAKGAARQAQADAQRQAQVQALIQSQEAGKAQEAQRRARLQAPQRAVATAPVAPQVAAILAHMSPIQIHTPQVLTPEARIAARPAPASPHTTIAPAPAYLATADVTKTSSSSASGESTSTAASSQSNASKKDTVQMWNIAQDLDVASGPIARRDSPQARSEKAESEKNAGEVDEDNAGQDDTSAPQLATAAKETRTTGEEELKNPFTKERKSLLWFEKKALEEAKKKAGKKAEETLGRHDEELPDWDTSDDDCAENKEQEATVSEECDPAEW
jgi:hypothetical protein